MLKEQRISEAFTYPELQDISKNLRRTDVIFENVPRNTAKTNQSLLTSGELYMVGLSVDRPARITTLVWTSGSQALVTGSNQVSGIFNSSRVLLAQSADGTNTAWAANAEKAFTLASSVDVVPGFYYLGLCIVATTVPSLTGVTLDTATSTLAPILAGASDTGLTSTLPGTAAAITGNVRFPWVQLK